MQVIEHAVNLSAVGAASLDGPVEQRRRNLMCGSCATTEDTVTPRTVQSRLADLHRSRQHPHDRTEFRTHYKAGGAWIDFNFRNANRARGQTDPASSDGAKALQGAANRASLRDVVAGVSLARLRRYRSFVEVACGA